ncbi:LysE/ArgO family amino acid transporter [Acinetobacter courvalinii]|uniref:LysE/ArgO family amino acid transporter n=1 Tax=Acinetobacter courvalinii TaxID=280147 RepID=A0AA42I9D5_9GAMM|nr:LysE/ArgO family amino acid transporter [Acinetobacter courvalinii]MCU4578430.1 LysE/ArgO family amino acid transporter [Acinetobacter courvalinii]MDH0564530.1 LysE/ArgO family amino acid transporter [Acinetobacter courvalinii]
MTAFFYGLGIGFSLILAIGAQNAFVLKQGLKQQHVFWVCLICALSDSILIYLGVTGFSKIVVDFPLIVTLAKYFGAAFLFLYGLRNFYSAIKNNSGLNPSEIEKDSLLKIIGMCLAFTWLNPHVYLDTVILVGSISVQFADQIYLFAAGTILASWIFFFALGYGARALLPLFKKASSWRVLDVLVGLMMWAIATKLLI